MRKPITIHDKMQQGYTYEYAAPMGKHFDPRFKPELSPKQMLRMGIFGGRYMRDCMDEFPKDWLAHAKMMQNLQPGHDKKVNYFGVEASQPLRVWQQKGWIHPQDPRGWFQWYCRYYIGRRSEDDERQIKRWLAMKRHITQLQNNCEPCDMNCRKGQRQALLHWAYDSRYL